MVCPKCKVQMKEQRGIHHKKRKWICRKCGKVRMQRPKPIDRRLTV